MRQIYIDLNPDGALISVEQFGRTVSIDIPASLMKARAAGNKNISFCRHTGQVLAYRLKVANESKP